MNNINRIINWGKAFLNFQLKREVCSHYPLQIWIEPTSYCNIKCAMCPNPSLDKAQKGHMPFERFQKIVDIITPFASSVSICHRGEPLLNKNIFEMIRYASSQGLKTSIHTNGTLLTEERSRKLIESGLSVISFSFDGYTKENYERIRVGADFEEVLNNTLQFLKIKRDMRSKIPHTTLQVIDIGESADVEEKREFIKQFEGLPLDRFYIKQVHNWGGKIGQEGGYKVEERMSKQNPICNSPWYSLVFHWDGTVYTCCLDYMDRYPIGNIDRDSWIEIWNGERMKQIRSEMKSGKMNECHHCTQCHKFYEKKFIGFSTENIFTQTLFRLRWNLSPDFARPMGISFVKEKK